MPADDRAHETGGHVRGKVTRCQPQSLREGPIFNGICECIVHV